MLALTKGAHSRQYLAIYVVCDAQSATTGGAGGMRKAP
jgi:hypothetical protein